MDKIHNGGTPQVPHPLLAFGTDGGGKTGDRRELRRRSSADIDTHALIDVCASLSKQLEGDKGDQMDKLRKRAMAAIGGYLRKIDKEKQRRNNQRNCLPFHRVPVFQQNTRRASAEPVQYIPQQTKGHGCGGAYRNGALGSKLHGGKTSRRY